MSALGLQREAWIDRTTRGPAQICGILVGLLEIGTIDFGAYRSDDLLQLAATDESGRSLGIPAAWDAELPAMFLENMLRDLTTKFLATTLEAENPDKIEDAFRQLGGMTVVQSDSTYVDPLGGGSRSLRGF